MQQIQTNPLRELLRHLLSSSIRQATVYRAEAADEVAALPQGTRSVIDRWLGSGRGNAISRKVLRAYLDEHFPR